MMNWKGSGRKQSWPNLRYYPAISLEELKKTTKASLSIALLGPRFEPGTSRIGSRSVGPLDHNVQ
jgi:hypothetical protein